MTDPTRTDVIPELVIKRDNIFIHPEDIERVLMDKLPGYIPDVSGGAQMPGCRLLTFKHAGVIKGLPKDMFQYMMDRCGGGTMMSMDPSEAVNKFFELFANYVLVKLFPDGQGNIVVEYTAMLNEEDTADLQEVAAEQRKAMNTKRAERMAAKAEADAKAKAEHDALMLVAKEVQAAGGIAERIAELVNEVNLLKDENKTLARKVRKK